MGGKKFPLLTCIRILLPCGLFQLIEICLPAADSRGRYFAISAGHSPSSCLIHTENAGSLGVVLIKLFLYQIKELIDLNQKSSYIQCKMATYMTISP
jgi:hypothetical protein